MVHPEKKTKEKEKRRRRRKERREASWNGIMAYEDVVDASPQKGKGKHDIISVSCSCAVLRSLLEIERKAWFAWRNFEEI